MAVVPPHAAKTRALGKPMRGPWLRAILMGQAKRLSMNPPTSEWGRSMLAKRGGYAVQQKYRDAGRVGPKHPAHRAAAISASRRKWRSREESETRQRQQLGLPPKRRWKYLPVS
ncbi:MAG: hypothetical protein WCA91_12760 [Candidatus Acidiferrales bacterium]